MVDDPIDQLIAQWREEADERLRHCEVLAHWNISRGRLEATATALKKCAAELSALFPATLPVETRQCEFRNAYGQRCIHRVGHSAEHACYGYQDPAFTAELSACWEGMKNDVPVRLREIINSCCQPLRDEGLQLLASVEVTTSRPEGELTEATTRLRGMVVGLRRDADKMPWEPTRNRWRAEADAIDAVLAEREEARKERDVLKKLLKDIHDWDHMDTAADGPFWRDEIRKAVAPTVPPTADDIAWAKSEIEIARLTAQLQEAQQERDEALAELGAWQAWAHVVLDADDPRTDAELRDAVTLDVDAEYERALAAESQLTALRVALEAEIERGLDWMKKAAFIIEQTPGSGFLSVVSHSDAMHALLFVRKVLRDAALSASPLSGTEVCACGHWRKHHIESGCEAFEHGRVCDCWTFSASPLPQQPSATCNVLMSLSPKPRGVLCALPKGHEGRHSGFISIDASPLPQQTTTTDDAQARIGQLAEGPPPQHASTVQCVRGTVGCKVDHEEFAACYVRRENRQ